MTQGLFGGGTGLTQAQGFGFDNGLGFQNYLQSNNAMSGNASLGTTPWSSLGAYGKMGVIGQGVGAFNSLAQIYGAFKNLKLQSKAFAHQQEGDKRQFNANAIAFNNTADDRASARWHSGTARGQNLGTLDAYTNTATQGRKVAQWG